MCRQFNGINKRNVGIKMAMTNIGWNKNQILQGSPNREAVDSTNRNVRSWQ